MNSWAWTLIGGAVTLAAAVSVILWQAFKHLDLKIERLSDKIERLSDKIDGQRNYFDKKFDQVMDGIAEISRLVAGHDAQIKAQEKQIDLLSAAVFGSQQFSAPGRRQDGEHAPEPAPPAASAASVASDEGAAASAGDPEPTPPTAVAPA